MTDVEKKLVNYFRERLTNQKYIFVKSKHLAKDIGGLSSYEIGTTLSKLSLRGIKGIKITQWSHSMSTTWRIDAV